MRSEVAVPTGEIGLPLERRSLLFVVNVGWFFLSHRLPLALAAKDKGYEVHVAATIEREAEADAIRAAGLTFHRLRGGRGNRPLLRELQQFADILSVLRRTRPMLVHAVTAKSIIFAGFAAKLTHRPALVGALTGLGHLFIEPRRFSILQKVITMALRTALDSRQCRLILQNECDLDFMIRERVVPPARAALIKGSGVDLDRFRPLNESDSPPVVVLPARMLREKGVIEFSVAATAVRREIPDARMVMVGGLDLFNPASLSEKEVCELCESSGVEWWGHVSDMRRVYELAHVVCLPSYREGLPKALLEAAAVGRAIVTTDVPGCRDVVEHGVSGLLVPARDPAALAEAVLALLRSPEMRRRFGSAAQERVRREFSLETVVGRTLSLYDDVLGARLKHGEQSQLHFMG